MIPLHMYADAEQGLVVDPAKLAGQGVLTDIGLLSRGTSEGRATVSMLVTLDDGSVVFAETSLRNFRVASAFLLASPIALAEEE